MNANQQKIQAEERVTDPTTGGQKGRKLERFDLLPWDALRWVARLFGEGAKKYAERNWEKGYSWSLSFAALQRHLLAWWQDGEWLDSETQCPHLAAVAWHAIVLLAFAIREKGTDDRPPGKPIPDPVTTPAPRRNAEPRKKRVYIAHPLGCGAVRAINRARAAWWVAWAADKGVIPIAPWVTVAEVWGEEHREKGLALDLETIAQCDEVWLCGERVSPGMAVEKKHAESLGIPIRDFTGGNLQPEDLSGAVGKK